MKKKQIINHKYTLYYTRLIVSHIKERARGMQLMK